jgi:hypothetical protein
MRLCKDCWYCYIEKEICCHEKSKIDLITGKRISNCNEMREEGECDFNAVLWRPKQYSPNKIYKMSIECPDCKMVFIFDLFKDDKGKRECRKCYREIWFPHYGINIPNENKSYKIPYSINEWKKAK